MAHHLQAALFHLGGVLHAKSTGRGIARIGKFILAISRAFLIDLLEILGSHIYLATDLDKLRDRVFSSSRQPMRNILDYAGIGSDLLAHRAVATSSSGGQAPIAINQVDRQAINLQLGEIGLSRCSIQPILHLASAKNIVQAHHALKVLNILAGARGSTHLLGGRIRHGKLWVLFF